MFTFWGFVTACTLIGGLPAVGGIWTFERRRSRRRNEDGKCAACGLSWAVASHTEPYLIHGRLICEDCAGRARRRMPWHFALLGVACMTATGLALEGADDVMQAILITAGLPAAMTVAALQLMKSANRRTQRRIANGECPEMVLLVGRGRPGASGNARR